MTPLRYARRLEWLRAFVLLAFVVEVGYSFHNTSWAVAVASRAMPFTALLLTVWISRLYDKARYAQPEKPHE